MAVAHLEPVPPLNFAVLASFLIFCMGRPVSLHVQRELGMMELIAKHETRFVRNVRQQDQTHEPSAIILIIAKTPHA